MIAVIHTGSVNLTKWVCYVPCRGVFAQSIQRRIQRWLYNPRINVHRLYKPLIQAALAEWEEKVIFLALDTSLFWGEYCLVRLCVVYRGRALPVVWRVMAHRSASVSFEDYQQMLQQAVGRLPTDKSVVLLADRGFVHSELMRMLTAQLGWHYRIRLKSNSWIWRSGKGWCQLKDFHFNWGEALCLHNVQLHKGERYGPIPRDAQRDWNCKARIDTVNELPWESAIENDIVTYWNQGKSRCQNLLVQGLN